MIKKIIDFPFPQNFSQMPKNVIDFNKNISLKSLPFKTKISNPLLMSTVSLKSTFYYIMFPWGIAWKKIFLWAAMLILKCMQHQSIVHILLIYFDYKIRIKVIWVYNVPVTFRILLQLTHQYYKPLEMTTAVFDTSHFLLSVVIFVF